MRETVCEGVRLAKANGKHHRKARNMSLSVIHFSLHRLRSFHLLNLNYMFRFQSSEHTGKMFNFFGQS